MAFFLPLLVFFQLSLALPSSFGLYVFFHTFASPSQICTTKRSLILGLFPVQFFFDFGKVPGQNKFFSNGDSTFFPLPDEITTANSSRPTGDNGWEVEDWEFIWLRIVADGYFLTGVYIFIRLFCRCIGWGTRIRLMMIFCSVHWDSNESLAFFQALAVLYHHSK